MPRASEAASQPSIRVLLADDTADVRILLRTMLELRDGFEVVGEASDGAEAVAMAADLRPDAILLDLAMPVMDGLQAIPWIRSRSPESRIIVLSGFNAKQIAAEAFERGAHAYLEKGATGDRLAATLLETCEGGDADGRREGFAARRRRTIPSARSE